MAATQVMRPGILVALKTSVNGGVHYSRVDLEEAADGTVARWETTREMDDPAEHRKARETSRLAARAISKLCVRTSFGMLCPLDREGELDLAIAAARVTVDLWNAEASHSWIAVNAIKGRIADNDAEAIRALIGEARDLVQSMDEGLAAGDVKAIRDSAKRALRLAGIMDDGSAETVTEAAVAARSAATEIVRRVGAKGEAVERVVESVDRKAFDIARFTFLDTADAELKALPPINKQRMREIETFRKTAMVPTRRAADDDDEDDE
jgi:hypothetical protein